VVASVGGLPTCLKNNHGIELQNSNPIMELLENNEMAGYQTDTENKARKHHSNPEGKIDRIESLFSEIMKELDLDLTDDSLQDTPRRVAKMYVNEIFSGLNADNEPRISNFDNVY